MSKNRYPPGLQHSHFFSEIASFEEWGIIANTTNLLQRSGHYNTFIRKKRLTLMYQFVVTLETVEQGQRDAYYILHLPKEIYSTMLFHVAKKHVLASDCVFVLEL